MYFKHFSYFTTLSSNSSSDRGFILLLWAYIHSLCPAPNRQALSDAFVWHLSVWDLSVAYIGPNSRTREA